MQGQSSLREKSRILRVPEYVGSKCSFCFTMPTSIWKRTLRNNMVAGTLFYEKGVTVSYFPDISLKKNKAMHRKQCLVTNVCARRNDESNRTFVKPIYEKKFSFSYLTDFECKICYLVSLKTVIRSDFNSKFDFTSREY